MPPAGVEPRDPVFGAPFRRNGRRLVKYPGWKARIMRQEPLSIGLKEPRWLGPACSPVTCIGLAIPINCNLRPDWRAIPAPVRHSSSCVRV